VERKRLKRDGESVLRSTVSRALARHRVDYRRRWSATVPATDKLSRRVRLGTGGRSLSRTFRADLLRSARGCLGGWATQVALAAGCFSRPRGSAAPCRPCRSARWGPERGPAGPARTLPTDPLASPTAIPPRSDRERPRCCRAGPRRPWRATGTRSPVDRLLGVITFGICRSPARAFQQSNISAAVGITGPLPHGVRPRPARRPRPPSGSGRGQVQYRSRSWPGRGGRPGRARPGPAGPAHAADANRPGRNWPSRQSRC
jgi:hypothetical protein